MPIAAPRRVKASSSAAVAIAEAFCANSGYGNLRQPEVQQLGMSLRRDENVCRLDVAMDDALAMCHRQGIGNLDAQFQHDLGLHRPARDPVCQGHSLQELHGDEGPLAILADFVDGADVGMVQR